MKANPLLKSSEVKTQTTSVSIPTSPSTSADNFLLGTNALAQQRTAELLRALNAVATSQGREFTFLSLSLYRNNFPSFYLQFSQQS